MRPYETKKKGEREKQLQGVFICKVLDEIRRNIEKGYEQCWMCMSFLFVYHLVNIAHSLK